MSVKQKRPARNSSPPKPARPKTSVAAKSPSRRISDKAQTTSAAALSGNSQPTHVAAVLGATSAASTGSPIVGIGASAGGLEALAELFEPMPDNTGAGFIVETHQHPGHTSMLPELLGKATKLPVVKAADGMKVEPNRNHVCPPGGYLALLNGTLHRMETTRTESPHLPIDYFLRSLAKDQKEKAICIILSDT